MRLAFIFLSCLIASAGLYAKLPIDFAVPLEREQYPLMLANFASSDRDGSAQVLAQSFGGFTLNYQVDSRLAGGNLVRTDWGSMVSSSGAIDPVRTTDGFALAAAPGTLPIDDSFSSVPGFLRLLGPNASTVENFPFFDHQKALVLTSGLYGVSRLPSRPSIIYGLRPRRTFLEINLCDPPVGASDCTALDFVDSADRSQIIGLRQFNNSLELWLISLEGERVSLLWRLADVEANSAQLWRDVHGHLAARAVLSSTSAALLLNFASEGGQERVVASGTVLNDGQQSSWLPLQDRSWVRHPRARLSTVPGTVSRWQLNAVQDNGQVAAPAQNIYTYPNAVGIWRIAHSSRGDVILIGNSSMPTNTVARNYLWLNAQGELVRSGNDLNYARFLDDGSALFLELGRAEGQLTLLTRWYSPSGEPLSEAKPLGKIKISSESAKLVLDRSGELILAESIRNQDGVRVVQISRVSLRASGEAPRISPVALIEDRANTRVVDNARYGQWFVEQPNGGTTQGIRVVAVDTRNGAVRDVMQCLDCTVSSLAALPNGGVLIATKTTASFSDGKTLIFDGNFALRTTLTSEYLRYIALPRSAGNIAQLQTSEANYGIQADSSVRLRNNRRLDGLSWVNLHADGTATWITTVDDLVEEGRYRDDGTQLAGVAPCRDRVDPDSGTCFEIVDGRVRYSRLDGSRGDAPAPSYSTAALHILSADTAIFGNDLQGIYYAQIGADDRLNVDDINSPELASASESVIVNQTASLGGIGAASRIVWTKRFFRLEAFPNRRVTTLFGAVLTAPVAGTQLLRDGFE